MECISCGAANPEGKRFCGDCGAQLVLRCPACDSESPPGKKFCGDCGASLAGETVPPADTAPKSPAPKVERRHLTVMFCDLAGSTELSHRLDPEDLREVMRRYQDGVAGAVIRYEGYVAKFLGDGVLAYFGWPRAHEDQAERGVRAGLDAVAAVAKVKPDKNSPLRARVGIATGQVVVGDLVGEAAAEAEAVAGETPNLAARLQELAAPGQVVIGASTRLLIGETFDLEDFGFHGLKGFTEPVAVWRVVGESAAESRFEAAHRGTLTQLVGREHELGLLRRAWEQSRAGIGQVVLVTGEPGIGKSRLVEALGADVRAEGCTRITLGCSPYHTNSALYPVIAHLERALRWQDKDNAEARLAKLERALQGFSLKPAEVVPLFASLLSLPLPEERYPPLNMTPQQERQQTLDAIVTWLLEEAERQPVLQVWEDLHWADPSTLELLTLEIEQAPTAPILNVLTFRPEFAPPWPQRSHMTPLTLNRLERPEVEALITQQAGGKVLPAEVVEHIVNKTDGVPLYVEELTKAILEADFLRECDTGYELTRPLSGVTIPATLQDSLMARLDRLPTIREVAQLGAVLGREFAYEVLQAIASLEETTLQDGLTQLVNAELLYQRGRPPRAKYIFKHALVQDAAYQSLLKRTRQFYHRQVAELIEKRFPETVEAHPELVAHHYTEASLTEKAIAYWTLAGEKAIQRSASVEAVDNLSRGLELLRELPETPERNEKELAMQLAFGPALVAAKGYGDPRVGLAYDRAWEICQQIRESPHVFIVLRGRQLHEMLAGEVPKAREIAKDLMVLAEQTHNSAMLVGGQHTLAQTNFYLGEFTAALNHAEAGIAAYDRKEHKFPHWPGGHPGTQCYIWAALAAWMLGFPDRARELGEWALAHASEEASQPFNVALTRAQVTYVHAFCREAVIAQAQTELLIDLCLEEKIPHWLEWGRTVHGWALSAQGQGEEGIIEARRGLEAFRALRTRSEASFLLSLFAEVCVELGQLDEAIWAIREAFDVMAKNKAPWWEADLHRLQGKLLLAEGDGDHAESENAFLRALSTARQQQAKSLELRAAASLARHWYGQGKADEARDLLVPIYGWFTEGIDTADLIDAKEFLDELK